MRRARSRPPAGGRRPASRSPAIRPPSRSASRRPHHKARRSGTHGADVDAWDAHVFPDDEPEGPFDLVLVSIQQYPGLDRGVELLERFGDEGDAPVLAFGQYAQFNSRPLAALSDGIVVGEPERIASSLAACAPGALDLDEVPGLGPARRL